VGSKQTQSSSYQIRSLWRSGELLVFAADVNQNYGSDKLNVNNFSAGHYKGYMQRIEVSFQASALNLSALNLGLLLGNLLLGKLT
jgi:hypothetical protein